MKVSQYFASIFVLSAGLSMAAPTDSLQTRQDRPPAPGFKMLVKDSAGTQIQKRQDRPPPPDKVDEVEKRQDRPPPPDKADEVEK
ncbi:uncharacterized protein LY89DRAFT_729250 [Mollisia scopiformis]|uniref:Uncharacterized protein n=1 Tax=Mollisia scopiformis TaxID=149040 RepID=A0A194XPS5_MOLSC|nr:uncharacterized protein LY89DRAFT_729250 [Mollisia scopiformis]KUJ21747.1 hypothetical protein LY89DRAFT_729250 [Mollisia scopiformis]